MPNVTVQNLQRYRRLRAAALRAGKCTRCLKEPASGGRSCPACRKEARLRQRKRARPRATIRCDEALELLDELGPVRFRARLAAQLDKSRAYEDRYRVESEAAE
mgnify:CR=1 FL=1